MQLLSASCLTAACVCSCTGSSSKTAELQSLVHRRGDWARSTLMVFCSSYQQKNVKRRAQKAKYYITNRGRRSWRITQIAVGCWRECKVLLLGCSLAEGTSLKSSLFPRLETMSCCLLWRVLLSITIFFCDLVKSKIDREKAFLVF